MSTVDEIKQRLDIVEVISGYVPLQKAGHNLKGLCPFHGEKTPSFIVFPETQTWHCFGACSTGGDVFTFIMRQENLEFPEALRLLADRAGVQVEPLTTGQREEHEELDRMRAINLAASSYYHHVLMESPAGQEARRYLERRGVLPETMRTFQLGYAPDEWHALEEHLVRLRYTRDELLAAGVLNKNEAGNIYDRFRQRVLFPVRDAQGQVLGFGGRALGDGTPKYLNTPETPLFDKGSILYGLDLARKAIRDGGAAIIVEGYMDVVILHQCGVTNAVACMGTALTEEHIATLKRLTRVLILALDPDAAGVRAVQRGAETAQQSMPRRTVPILSPTGLVRYEEQLDAEIRVLLLPDGLDPDELILRDRARWDQLLAQAPSIGEFLYRQALADLDLSSAKGKREAVVRVLPLLAQMDNAVERTHYLQRLAQAVHIDERQFLPEVQRLRGQGRGEARRGRAQRPPLDADAPPPDEGSTEAASQSASAAGGAAAALEERCLALLLAAPELLSEVMGASGLTADTFVDVRHQRVFAALASFASTPDVSLGALRERLDSESSARVESLAQKLGAGPPLSTDMIREDLFKCATRLRKAHLSRLLGELRFLQQEAQEQGPAERFRELTAVIDGLTRDYLQIDQRFHAATYMGRRQLREQNNSDHA